jgi:beta-N-acetylglucosaminidase
MKKILKCLVLFIVIFINILQTSIDIKGEIIETEIITEVVSIEEIEIIIEEEVEKLEVVYYRDDITIKSNISKDELREVFMNYKGASTMAHLADAIVDAEEEYSVNAFAIAGIVALESGFATSRRAVEDNNLTGYEVYNDKSKGKLFDSQYESIMQTARHLAKNYLTEGGLYYKGVSVDAVQKSYCPDIKNNWHNRVDLLASGFLNVHNELMKSKNT